MAYGCVAPSARFFGPSVHRGPGNRRSIALTFDDGPSEGTLPLLETLSRLSVSATFFQCGANVRRLPHIARQVAASGHELGNHSDTHPWMVLRTPGFIDREFSAAQNTIVNETGVTPKLLRAPYGLRWPMWSMQTGSLEPRALSARSTRFLRWIPSVMGAFITARCSGCVNRLRP
ncbi:MAG: polysaccharide deacetylase family protein [Acidobacteriota bacterium]